MINLNILEIERHIDNATQGFSIEEFEEFKKQIENSLDKKQHEIINEKEIKQ